MMARRRSPSGTARSPTRLRRAGLHVWGQVMVQLKRYLETGVAAPVFVNS